MSGPRARAGRAGEAAAAGGHAVIEASAGTGKTWRLENLVVDAVVSGTAGIGEILVVTFTDKGARELRDRVRQALERRLAGAGDGERARILGALAGFDGASISTIHSFCSRVIEEQPILTGRSFGEEIADGRRLFGTALRDVVRHVLAEDCRARDLLVAALEGGSTVDGIEASLEPIRRERGTITPAWDPEGLTAAVMAVPGRSEIEADLPGDLRSIHAGTRKALARRAADLADIAEDMRREGSIAGLPAAIHAWRFSYSGEEEAIDYCLGRIPVGLPPGGTAARLRSAIEEIAARATTPVGALAAEILPRVRDLMDARKLEEGLHDFDDMLAIVRDALAGPGGEELASRLSRRFRLALVDEFQDTDEIQWEIFRRIFLEGGGGGSLVVVGDPKQAIYGFRGADVHTYVEACREIEAAGGRRQRLVDNHRSTAPMIEAVDMVIESGFLGGINRYEGPAGCGRPELSLVGADGLDAVPLVLLHPEATPGPPRKIDDLRASIGAGVAREIRAILDPCAPSLRFGERGAESAIAPGDIHVLVRTAEEGRGVAAHLKALGIPHAFFKQDGLFATREASDVRHLLEAIADPRSRSARFRAWLTPFFGLSLDEAAAACNAPAVDPLVSRLLSWGALAEAGRWDRLQGSIVEESGIARRLLLERHGEREITNHLHVLEILFEDVRRRPCTTFDLAARLASWIVGKAGPPGDEGDLLRLPDEHASVQILTMHKSKGLEASVVFVAGGLGRTGSHDSPEVYHLSGRRFAHLPGAWTGPDVRDAIDAEAHEEDQRLLYVAMTRAKARLYLPYLGPFKAGGIDLPGAMAGAIEGCASILDDRLRSVIEGPDRSRWPRLLGAIDLPAPGYEARETREAPDLGSWTPPEIESPDRCDLDLEASRAGHEGFVITSYSMMKSQSGDAYHAPAGEPDGAEPAADEAEPAGPGEHGMDLPGGLSTGTFLHEVLEGLDMAAVASTPTPEEWARTPAAAALLDRCASRAGFPPDRIPAAARMLHGSLRCPVRLDDLVLDGGFSGIGRSVAEMEFLYPIPEAWHGSPACAAAAHSVGRGMVRGFVDLAFEHRGKTYILDWKSDVLPSWDAVEVARHVEANYSIQAAVYTLALARMLGVGSASDLAERMGGVIYCFLRGMAGGTDGRRGMLRLRPTWEEIASWERALLVHGLDAGREPGRFGISRGGRG